MKGGPVHLHFVVLLVPVNGFTLSSLGDEFIGRVCVCVCERESVRERDREREHCVCIKLKKTHTHTLTKRKTRFSVVLYIQDNLIFSGSKKSFKTTFFSHRFVDTLALSIISVSPEASWRHSFVDAAKWAQCCWRLDSWQLQSRKNSASSGNAIWINTKTAQVRDKEFICELSESGEDWWRIWWLTGRVKWSPRASSSAIFYVKECGSWKWDTQIFSDFWAIGGTTSWIELEIRLFRADR